MAGVTPDVQGMLELIQEWVEAYTAGGGFEVVLYRGSPRWPQNEIARRAIDADHLEHHFRLSPRRWENQRYTYVIEQGGRQLVADSVVLWAGTSSLTVVYQWPFYSAVR